MGSIALAVVAGQIRWHNSYTPSPDIFPFKEYKQNFAGSETASAYLHRRHARR